MDRFGLCCLFLITIAAFVSLKQLTILCIYHMLLYTIPEELCLVEVYQ